MSLSVEDLRLAHGSLSRVIIGAFYDVYNEIGYGFPEGMYGEAMAFALRDRGLTFERERQLVVRYRNRVSGLIVNIGAKAGIRRVIWTGRDLVRSSS